MKSVMELSTKPNERLAEVVAYLTLSGKIRNKTDFANQLGKHKSVVSDYVNGKQNVSEIFLRKVTDLFPEINWRWILTGEGKMLSEQTQQNIINAGDNSIATIDQSIKTDTSSASAMNEVELLKMKLSLLEERNKELSKSLDEEKERSLNYWEILSNILKESTLKKDE